MPLIQHCIQYLCCHSRAEIHLPEGVLGGGGAKMDRQRVESALKAPRDLAHHIQAGAWTVEYGGVPLLLQ